MASLTLSSWYPGQHYPDWNAAHPYPLPIEDGGPLEEHTQWTQVQDPNSNSVLLDISFTPDTVPEIFHPDGGVPDEPIDIMGISFDISCGG